ncbi:MAG: 4Fe-4S dicluster domain-containing protein, partial [Firmicutes bacterium]|nr:4Fe-4S dicluster domain-containing protein [Bacillota bacterium]
ISGTFTAMNYLSLYQDKALAAGQENWLVGRHQKERATQCIQCGKCEQVCPQHISIRKELERCAKELY